MGEEKKELLRLYRDKQEKYIYYVIAICIAAIGFSVNKTFGAKLEWSQVPLAFAILSWAYSIFSGFNYIKLELSVVYLNVEQFKIIDGEHPLSGNHPQKMKIGYDVMQEIMEKKSEAAQKEWIHLEYGLYVGIFFFLFWRVLEMYLLK